MLLGIPIIGEFLTKSLHVCRHYLYDFSDRLHFGLTTYILAFFVLLVGARQHFGNPIDCMLPKEINDIDSWKNFISSYCLIYGTYRFTVNQTSIHFPGHSEKTTVAYYQWVPFFLAFQIFCFILPHWIWTWMQKLLYLDMSLIVEHTNELLGEKSLNEHKKKLECLIGYAYEHFKYRRLHKIGYFSFIFIHPAFACSLYFFTKFLFIFNDILQLNLVTSFLGFDSITWGLEMIHTLIFKRSEGLSAYDLHFSEASGSTELREKYNEFNHFKAFPILVACDFHTIPSVKGLNNNTAQCVIPLNIINEKIFVILWLWFILLLAFGIFSIFQWFFKFYSKNSRENVVFQLLNNYEIDDINKYGRTNKNRIVPAHRHDFVHKFLSYDGVLLVYFMIGKCGILKTQEVINGLYEKFNEDFAKPTKPVLLNKGEKTDYSEMNFGADEEDVFLRKNAEV